MSVRCTTSAEVELQVDDAGGLCLRFCDAQVAQWDEPMDNIADWDNDDRGLREAIAAEIENAADDLATSIVRDLRKRLAPSSEGRES